MNSAQRRKQRKDIIGLTIIVVLATPMIIVLIIGAALSLAGCAEANVVCTFDWGVSS